MKHMLVATESYDLRCCDQLDYLAAVHRLVPCDEYVTARSLICRCRYVRAVDSGEGSGSLAFTSL
jgi:hypothetical protein